MFVCLFFNEVELINRRLEFSNFDTILTFALREGGQTFAERKSHFGYPSSGKEFRADYSSGWGRDSFEKLKPICTLYCDGANVFSQCFRLIFLKSELVKSITTFDMVYKLLFLYVRVWGKALEMSAVRKLSLNYVSLNHKPSQMQS